LTADPARKRSDGSSPALTAPRVVAGALGVVVISFAVLVLVLLWQRQGQAAYVMPVAVPVAAILCVALTFSGAVLATYRSQAIAPWLTLLTTLLFGAALVALLSIGVFILVVGVLCLLVRLRVRGTLGGRSGRLFVGAGLLLSLGLAPLSVLAIQGPIVSCTSNGVSTGTPVWTDFGGGGSGSSSTGEGSSNSNQTNGTVKLQLCQRQTCQLFCVSRVRLNAQNNAPNTSTSNLSLLSRTTDLSPFARATAGQERPRM
jgi:hypothetical protein